MTADVESLAAHRADRENNNTLITPVECLEDAVREIRNGKRSCTSVLVLTLDRGESGSDYGWGFYASNLSSSEMISLMRVSEHHLVKTITGD